MTDEEANSGIRSRAPRGARVLLAGLDRLPRTILTSLLEPVHGLDVIVREELEDEALPDRVGDLVDWLDEVRADVVILATSDDVPLATLKRVLRSRVMVVTDRGHALLCYHLEPRQKTAREISPGDLLRMITSSRDDPSPDPRSER